MTLECPVRLYRMFPQRVRQRVFNCAHTTHTCKRTLLCALSKIERLFLFSAVLRVPPALDAEHGEADDEAQQDQDEDDAACDGAARVHCRAPSDVDKLDTSSMAIGTNL